MTLFVGMARTAPALLYTADATLPDHRTHANMTALTDLSLMHDCFMLVLTVYEGLAAFDRAVPRWDQ